MPMIRAIRGHVQLEDLITQFAHRVLVYDSDSIADQPPTLGMFLKNIGECFPFLLSRSDMSKNLDYLRFRVRIDHFFLNLLL